MLGTFWHENRVDANGNPAGGSLSGKGLSIEWQDGPLGRGADRIEPNGAFVETVIAAAKSRLVFYQEGKFACADNAEMIEHLDAALAIAERRTARREAQGVEGTHTLDVVPASKDILDIPPAMFEKLEQQEQDFAAQVGETAEKLNEVLGGN